MFPIYVVIGDSDPRFFEIATQFLQKREGVLVYSAVSTSNDILMQEKVFEPAVVLYNLDESDPQSLDTFKKIRSQFPELSIIVVSPPQYEELKPSIVEAGANDFVLRNAMNLEFFARHLEPDFNVSASLWNVRYSYNTWRKKPMRLIPPTPKVNGPQWFAH